MKRITVVLAVLGLLLCVALGKQKLPDRSGVDAGTVISGATMGTSFSIRAAARLPLERERGIRKQVNACLERINDQMSTYRPASEISRFNRYRSDDWFQVSHETALVVASSLEVARLTEGAFDITVGPVVNLWSFGPDQRPKGVPSRAEIEVALAHVGYQDIEVRNDPPALRKKKPQIYIDLSGIAKGFAVDRIAGLLDEHGIEHYLVEIGGEVRSKGMKSDGSPWRIGIERPVLNQRSIYSVVHLTDRALATSGDYRNFFEWRGKLYSHEIDPHTGYPVSHGVASVTVLGASCMAADAMATALLVMDPESAWRLVEQEGLDVMMIFREQDKFRRRTTPGFDRTVVQPTLRGQDEAISD